MVVTTDSELSFGKALSAGILWGQERMQPPFGEMLDILLSNQE